MYFCADILYYTQEITQFIPEELVAEIPEELLEKYPLTKQLLENDKVAQTVKSMYDGYYFLPKPDSADPTIYKAERKGIFIRKDLAGDCRHGNAYYLGRSLQCSSRFYL